ncbi:Calnexin, partial [Pseudolycoriella hygida]
MHRHKTSLKGSPAGGGSYHHIAMIIYWVLFVAVLGQTAKCDELDIDGSVLTAEEEELIHPSQSTTTPSPEENQTIFYESPYATPGKFHFAENFDKEEYLSRRWVKSTAKKDDIEESLAKYDGEWSVEEPRRPILKGDLGLVLKSKAKHAAISSRLNKPFVFADQPLIVQYEVQLQVMKLVEKVADRINTRSLESSSSLDGGLKRNLLNHYVRQLYTRLDDGQECGGAYIKLLSSGKETTDLKQFNDMTPYTIMFGPDKCGNDIKLHFIFKHTNPLNGSVTEKHCRKAKERIEEPFKDKQPHLYQLIVRPDNTYTISVDHKVVNEGSLLTDFTPPVNPPKLIDDVTDIKPADWDEREKISDPDAKRPDDWNEDEPPQIPDISTSKPEGWLDDEETMIPDVNAVKPDDWDPEMDGEWEPPLVANPVCEKAVGCGLWKAPLISNPNYKGKWRAPLIDNPNYQGKWAPRKIENPDYYEDLNPFKMATIAAVGIELWTMSADILFDNIIITSDEYAANDWAAKTYDLKRMQIDKESETFATRVINVTNANPWLWAVYVVVGGLPLAFLLYYCFASSGKDKPSHTSTHHKKTDEPVRDDEEPSLPTINLIVLQENVENVEAEPAPAEAPAEGAKKRKPRKD